MSIHVKRSVFGKKVENENQQSRKIRFVWRKTNEITKKYIQKKSEEQTNNEKNEKRGKDKWNSTANPSIASGLGLDPLVTWLHLATVAHQKPATHDWQRMNHKAYAGIPWIPLALLSHIYVCICEWVSVCVCVSVCLCVWVMYIQFAHFEWKKVEKQKWTHVTQTKTQTMREREKYPF